jgi:hypothetical protein
MKICLSEYKGIHCVTQGIICGVGGSSGARGWGAGVRQLERLAVGRVAVWGARQLGARKVGSRNLGCAPAWARGTWRARTMGATWQLGALRAGGSGGRGSLGRVAGGPRQLGCAEMGENRQLAASGARRLERALGGAALGVRGSGRATLEARQLGGRPVRGARGPGARQLGTAAAGSARQLGSGTWEAAVEAPGNRRAVLGPRQTSLQPYSPGGNPLDFLKFIVRNRGVVHATRPVMVIRP